MAKRKRKKKTLPPPAPSAYPWRVLAGVAVVLLMAVLALDALGEARTGFQTAPGQADTIGRGRQRFEDLRALLPPRGTVGFLSDAGSNLQSYYLTQYWLAPLVVAPDARHDLVVANFVSLFAIAEAAAANGLTVKQDFHNGVALLVRSPGAR
jgi:hypothetical protein